MAGSVIYSLSILLVVDYKEIREVSNGAVKDLGIKLYPSYDPQLLRGKKVLRPAGIVVKPDGSDAFCAMQSVLDHTVSRSLQLPEVAAKLEEVADKSRNLGRRFQYIAYAKTGEDGLSGLKKFNQKIENELQTDGKLMASHIALLQLVARDPEAEEERGPLDDIVIYTNPLLNSADGCRPLRILCRAESRTLGKEELDRLREEIRNLVPLHYNEDVSFEYHVKIF